MLLRELDLVDADIIEQVVNRNFIRVTTNAGERLIILRRRGETIVHVVETNLITQRKIK